MFFKDIQGSNLPSPFKMYPKKLIHVCLGKLIKPKHISQSTTLYQRTKAPFHSQHHNFPATSVLSNSDNDIISLPRLQWPHSHTDLVIYTLSNVNITTTTHMTQAESNSIKIGKTTKLWPSLHLRSLSTVWKNHQNKHQRPPPGQKGTEVFGTSFQFFYW